MILSKVVGFIPARGNSKGVKHKNLQGLGKKPLILWTIETAKQVCDEVIVSSEDSQTLELASLQGVVIEYRNSQFSEDNVTATEVLLNYLIHHEYSDNTKILLLQPTSPFRSVESLIKTINVLDVADFVVSVVKGHGVNTYGHIEDDLYRTFKPLCGVGLDRQRQDTDCLYRKNGAIFGALYNRILSEKSFNSVGTGAIEMSLIESIEIDTYEDLELARIIEKGLRTVGLQ
jgi:CMP-N,N'-diacetyllegionaminic acid synthase